MLSGGRKMKHKYYVVISAEYSSRTSIASFYCTLNHKMRSGDLDRIPEEFKSRRDARDFNGEKPKSAIITFFSEVKK